MKKVSGCWLTTFQTAVMIPIFERYKALSMLQLLARSPSVKSITTLIFRHGYQE
jgi:hypothetical protein